MGSKRAKVLVSMSDKHVNHHCFCSFEKRKLKSPSFPNSHTIQGVPTSLKAQLGEKIGSEAEVVNQVFFKCISRRLSEQLPV